MEEAEKLNDEAIIEFEIWKKIRAKETQKMERGFVLMYSDDFKDLVNVPLSKTNENHLIKNKYDIDDFSKIMFPKLWRIDYSSMPSGVTFQGTDEGYSIISNQGTLRITGQRINSMRSSFIFEVTVENCSNKDCDFSLGINNSGLIKNGNTILVSEIIPSKEKKTLEAEIDVFDHFENIAPIFTLKGAGIIENFKIYKKDLNQSTIVEGEIVERSELPDPQKTDYPNCRFTVHFTGNAIKSGDPCPKELALIVEGIENYHILPNNNIKKGDKILCTIVPFELLPEDFQSTQQADDLALFLLENYYVVNMKKIEDYTDNELMPVSGIYFSDGDKDYMSLFDRHINAQIPEHTRTDQIICIKKDLEKMNHLLEGIKEERYSEINKLFFEKWEIEKAKDPPGYNRVEKNFVWRNLDNSFWTLPERTSYLLSKPNELSQKTLDCFLSLKQVLEANGVQLIVSLVPEMDTISARVIMNEFKDIPDIQTATYVKQLSEIGIETIYASDLIINNYNRYPFAFFVPKNAHPSDTAQDVLTDILAERLKRYEIDQQLDPNLFSEVQVPHGLTNYPGFLFPQNCDIGNNQAEQSYTCRDVLYNGKKIQRSKESSVMVVGNSYIETPICTPDSLPTLLSYKIHASVDWYRIRGFGPFSDILIQILSNPDLFLKNKKVVIFQVGTCHMNQVNDSGIMLDIAALDSERILLNKKKKKGLYSLSSNVSPDQIFNPELWGPLSTAEKSVLMINERGKLTYSFNVEDIGNDIVDSAPIVIVIPHTGMCNTHLQLSVNGISKAMNCPNHVQNQRFFNLAFELPVGAKEITIQIEGNPGSLVAIKDIQIYQ